jgi:hypothetical protein
MTAQDEVLGRRIGNRQLALKGRAWRKATKRALSGLNFIVVAFHPQGFALGCHSAPLRGDVALLVVLQSVG